MGSLESKVISNILAGCDSSGAFIDQLYRHLKANDRRVSIAQICRRAGMPSKGYLSDVMKGKRTLNMNYHAGLSEALGLKGRNSKYFELLLRIEHEPDPDRQVRLRTRLDGLRKSFEVRIENDPVVLRPDSFQFQVFCAFGLSREGTTRAGLIKYFGRAQAVDVDNALAALRGAGLVTEKDGKMFISDRHIIFSAKGNHASEVEFIKASLTEATEKVAALYPKSSESHFESVIISASRKKYLEKLKGFKDELLSWQSDLETDEADTLIRMNVQIYQMW